jgi:hypothetical protein
VTNAFIAVREGGIALLRGTARDSQSTNAPILRQSCWLDRVRLPDDLSHIPLVDIIAGAKLNFMKIAPIIRAIEGTDGSPDTGMQD